MKSFKKVLQELRNPSQIAAYKKDIQHINKVDNRDNHEWQKTLHGYMSHYGFSPISSGKYGTVFTNPKYQYAIKIFLKDTAYLKFLQFVIKNPNNKYLPKIRGKVVKINSVIYAVRLEKLVQGNRAAQELSYFLQDPEDVLEGLFDDSQYKLSIEDRDIRELCMFMVKNKNLADIHLGNILERPNGTPVLIDPLYNYYRGGGFTIDPDDVSNMKELF